jgi:hypothetical protein
MRFFTMDWWHDVQSGSAEDPSDAYERHLASLRPFPNSVAQLQVLPSLHDAHVRRVDHLGTSVGITLETWDDKGELVPIRLSYSKVESFTVTADAERSLPGPAGFGDLGYDEIDSPRSGVFEHRFLFSSGMELSVRFSDFSFSLEAAQPAVADGASTRR